MSFSGIGTTSAAATATALCERLEPDCIIMCGSAGGLTAGQKTGDLVIGASVVDIDLYTLPRALTGTPYEPCLTDPHLAKPLVFEFKPHPLFLGLCADINLPNMSLGKIVTSNTFPAPEATFQTIIELGCNAIEMESTGVLMLSRIMIFRQLWFVRLVILLTLKEKIWAHLPPLSTFVQIEFVLF